MPLLRQTLNEEWEAASSFRPDLIVYHPKALGGRHIAEKLGVPVVMALALPLYTSTSAFATPIMPSLGGAFNRFSYSLLKLIALPYGGLINDFRQNTLGLPRQGRFASDQWLHDGRPMPFLYAYSPHLLPVPDDYPPHVFVSGCWFLEQEPGWQPSPALQEFLAAGPAPVYVGFGSMSGSRPQERAQHVLKALAQTGQRGLLASGWGGLAASQVPPDVFVIDQAPHDWLFERVSAVVHHGGAGTTAAGLRAGRPTLIVPFIADQPFWGRVVAAGGWGPPPIPQKSLNADRLAQALRQMSADAAMRQRASDIGQRLRAEDGVANAVNWLQTHLR